MSEELLNKLADAGVSTVAFVSANSKKAREEFLKIPIFDQNGIMVFRDALNELLGEGI